MKIFLLSITIVIAAANVPSGRMVSITRWQEELTEPEVLLDREEVLEPADAFPYQNSLPFEGLTEQVKRIPSPAETPLQTRSMAKSFCTCETLYEVRDLGEGHYPRYLTASRCKPKPCQDKFNTCSVLYYMVHVLRQRNLNEMTEDSADSTLPETPLPESLRQKWQLKPMSISVACVPAADNGRF